MKENRECSYNKDWEKKYECLAATYNSQEAMCIMCSNAFNIDNIGVVFIKQRKTSDTHTSNCNASASNSLIHFS